MTALLYELRHALRSIAARPASSALVIAVLAAGLACVIFMLAIVNGLVLRPLPFAVPEQLLHAGVHGDSAGGGLDPLTNRDLAGIRRDLAAKAEVAGVARSTINLSDLDRPERTNGAFVSANLFRVLGVAPSLGRDFSADDERAGAQATAMLSYELWKTRYGGDPAIAGRQVRINAQLASVIGVMPEHFSYPRRETIWLPATLSESTEPDGRSYWVVLRRHADASDLAIGAALDGWFAEAARAEPERFRGLHPGIEPLAYMAVDRATRTMAGAMLAAVFIVLLVACANAANLLLTRTLGRRQEFAVRIALGASRKRLATHLLAESLLLSLIATAIAWMLANAGVSWQRTLFRQAEFAPPLWLSFDLDGALVVLALGAALVTAFLTGLLPALSVGEAAIAGDLRDGAHTVAGRSFARVSAALVVAEVALSCALLICVGTLVRGIAALDRAPLGIDESHLLTARLALFTSTYPTGADQLRLYERLGDRLRADADVVDATVATVLPGTFYNETRDLLPLGAVPGDAALPTTKYGAVDDHFLAAYGIRLRQGRFFDSRDRTDGERVAVVDQNFVERYSHDAPILGRRFRLDPRDPHGATVLVVGVVDALKLDAPGETVRSSLLVPLRQGVYRVASIAVRARADAMAFAPRLNGIMHELDADTPLYWVRDYPAVIRSVTFDERTVAQSFGISGIVALILAGAGLYGVMAFSVGQRTREVGLRRALGAPAAHVLREVVGRAGRQIALGLGLGLAVGIPFARRLTDTLPSIEASDPLIVGGAMLVLIAAATVAVIVPVRRALRIDPMTALRHE